MMRCLLLAILLLATGCAQRGAEPSNVSVAAVPRVQVTASRVGLVVSDSPIASAVGARVLAKGGNAVDAAVATAFALAVTWPEAGNIGGGGFMLVAGPDQEPVAIDYRETAPAVATVDMYTPGENRYRARHVGVPGTVAGLTLAHERLGTLPWADLVRPAVALARDGFEIDAALADSINAVLSGPASTELARVYGKPGGGAWVAGDTLALPDLAETLDAIARSGASGFYEGDVAEALTSFMAGNGGLVTADDLADYEAKEREPTRTIAFGHEIFGMPPPSSGGVTVGLILRQVEALDPDPRARFDARTIHLLAESMRRAFHQRALHLGDPDFGRMPMNTLLGPELAVLLADSIDPDHATPSETLSPAIPLANESPDTTHFSVIDANGLAVANTYTLEESWGSRTIAPGLGFVLNNEMGDFNWVAGRTTRGGAIGTEANLIAPGKRPLSSMSPTLVMRDGRVVGVTGSPGGRTIINTTALILLNVFAFDMPPVDAVAAPRFHHQWLPDRIVMERPHGVVDWPQPDLLEAMGHAVEVRNSPQGSAHTIWWDDDSAAYFGIADYRRRGAANAPAE